MPDPKPTFGAQDSIPLDRIKGDGLISRFTGAKLTPAQVAMQAAYAALPDDLKDRINFDSQREGVVYGSDLLAAVREAASRPKPPKKSSLEIDTEMVAQREGDTRPEVESYERYRA